MTRPGRYELVAAVCLAMVVAVGCGSGVTETADAPGPTTTTSDRAPRDLPTSTTAAIPSTTTVPPCTADAAVADWPLRRRLAQLIMPTLPADAGAASLMVAVFQPGGVFLADGSGGTMGAVGPAVDASDPVPPFVAVDEEGGRVQRIFDGIGALPSARQMAATLTEDEVRALGARVGSGLSALGVTMDFAPVADVSAQPDGEVIGDRSFSNDPAVATRYAGAFAEGLRDGGVIPVVKHFPGHGHSSGDSHQGAVTTPALDAMRSSDLVPYETLLDDEPVAVMMGHLDVPGLTEPGVPSSLSPAALRLLREDYGFDGVVFTDDLGGMGAVTQRFGELEASRMALTAGVDMVLIGRGDLGGLVDHLEQAVVAGTLPEARVNESVVRILTAKDVDPCEVVLPGA